jgi:hypothetical protein
VSVRDALVHRLRKRTVVGMARVACWVALVGLALLCASIIYPAPLLIIVAMSAGQVIGIVAFLCYLLSVLMDVVRGADHGADEPGPARKISASDASVSRDSA